MFAPRQDRPVTDLIAEHRALHEGGAVHLLATIDGQDVSDLPPNRRPTNMVFQSYAIFPHLNVRDNIAYGLRSEGVPAAERDARVDPALAMDSLVVGDGLGTGETVVSAGVQLLRPGQKVEVAK